MPEDQETREVSTERLFHNVGVVLAGLSNVVETFERLLTSLNGIAKNLQTMEENGSLSHLLELLQSADQETAAAEKSRREKRSRKEDEEE
ncbi:MAG TPA: hypothetical protein GXX47_02020 [Firmicutes bacterium]|nr:hypothetical protein [Bacillota bacterium]